MKNAIRLFICFAILTIGFSASAQTKTTQQKDLNTTLRLRHERNKAQKNKRKFLKSKSTTQVHVLQFINDSRYMNREREV